jgi:glycogen debranching enzyme
VTGPLTFADESASLGQLADRLTLVSGSAFCISDVAGAISPSRPHGLFLEDTRVLSRLELRVDAHPPEPLTSFSSGMRSATIVARTRRPADGWTLLVLRRRALDPSFRETIALRNVSRVPARCEVTLTLGADHATVFDVKEQRPTTRPSLVSTPLADGLAFGDDDRRTLVTFDRDPSFDAGTVTFAAEIAPKAEWTLAVRVAFETPNMRRRVGALALEPPDDLPAVADLTAIAPRVSSDDHRLVEAYERSIADLAVLRIVDARYGARPVLAAGAPWFMTLFGRDSILASRMALAVDPALAVSTLHVLAGLQGTDVNDATEEQPGRILHEVRYGRSPLLGPGQSDIYYGTIDATPLFVGLAGEVARWGVEPEVLRPLLPHLDRALAWIRDWGDEDGDGYVEYRRRSEHGLANQGWKDSHDAIAFADGRPAHPPIALCEVQGYVYAAYLARAELAELFGEDPTSWRAAAIALKERFNRDFWLEDQGWYALALDGNKQPVDALASNVGHALWSGIVDAERAPLVAERFLSREVFTGWGVRTLATSMSRYDPLSYHNGSVWPHDTALAAAGLARYGLVAAARRVIDGLLDLAERYDPHLPELLSGLSRDDVAAPVDYPASSAPQAWAAAAPLLALRTLLRLDPRVPAGRLHVSPIMPPRMRRVEIRGLALGDRRVDLRVEGDHVEASGLDGLELVVEPFGAG